MRIFLSKLIGAVIVLGSIIIVTNCTGGKLDFRKEKDMAKINDIILPMFEGVRVTSIHFASVNPSAFSFDAYAARIKFIDKDDSLRYKNSDVIFSKVDDTETKDAIIMPRQIMLGHKIPADFSFTTVAKVVNDAIKEIESRGIAVDGVVCSVDFSVKDINDATIRVTAQHKEESTTNGRMVTTYYSEVHVRSNLAGEIIYMNFEDFEGRE